MCGFDRGRFIIVYADDILLLSPSVMDLEKLVHLCERELIWLDMTINCKKSCCVRIGPCCDVECANITTLSGHVLEWTNEIRYLGIFIVQSRTFKCALDYAKSCHQQQFGFELPSDTLARRTNKFLANLCQCDNSVIKTVMRM